MKIGKLIGSVFLKLYAASARIKAILQHEKNSHNNGYDNGESSGCKIFFSHKLHHIFPGTVMINKQSIPDFYSIRNRFQGIHAKILHSWQIVFTMGFTSKGRLYGGRYRTVRNNVAEAFHRNSLCSVKKQEICFMETSSECEGT